ncbi:MAG: hypothetical protein JRI23_33765, partial [Deltaproteobacteria bacterium]|nr:hypothetical protein [Deltaproteobacteria bacterium]
MDDLDPAGRLAIVLLNLVGREEARVDELAENLSGIASTVLSPVILSEERE